LHSKDWSLALPRSRQLPSCVTAYPRGSRSCVLMALPLPHSQSISKDSIWFQIARETPASACSATARQARIDANSLGISLIYNNFFLLALFMWFAGQDSKSTVESYGASR